MTICVVKPYPFHALHNSLVRPYLMKKNSDCIRRIFLKLKIMIYADEPIVMRILCVWYKDRCFILVMSQEMVYSYITHSNRFLSGDDFLEELFMYMTMPTKTATFLGFYVLLTLIPHKNWCSFFRKWKFSKYFCGRLG